MPVNEMNAELTARLSSADLTYGHVGATAGTLPSGYHHLRMSRQVGLGADAFVAAAAALLSWQVHMHAGLRVTASAPTAAPGSLVLLGLGPGPLRIGASCRVVYTVADSRRRGFAYGTLPGHPESGEEAFIVEHCSDDRVTFTITAFSRPASPVAQAAGPAGRLMQKYVTRRYLEALDKIIVS